ncbi:MAG: hypothetical protein A3K19_32945 [Lentisphaerae bacterium RIFOXYB12_FULL_65_16]|nr:MAG: hypothetical protein A3K18_15220 [Lentisphaerae bacterium RIFOXYA12_64_32]OGV87043.1 MAG: hypothetical protein A3K19_32945 [Lentisphaerae bacterium RIFOXYB12_FULL_65_16]
MFFMPFMVAMFAICHTFYSLQVGVRSPGDWARAAAARGYTALAIADLNNLHGAVHFYREVEAVGLHPIIGATLQWEPEHACIVLVESEAGYRNLCRLLTRRHLDARFRLDTIGGEATDGLIFLSRSAWALVTLARVLPPNRLYRLPPATPAAPAATKTPGLWDMALGTAIPEAHVPDAWLIDPDDWEALAYLADLQHLAHGSKRSPEPHPGMLLPAAAEWQQRYPEIRIAVELCERCQFRFPFDTVLLPSIQVPPGQTAAAHLNQLCRAGLTAKYPASRRAQADARLTHELAVIDHHGFADYFLYVHEIIRFAQAHDIPVEVRGSAASSIVSYLLGFTHCCPIEHDLYFERFMNPGRHDCPDIDVDIADNRREQVIRYCYQRWGEKHVAMIATILTYRTRSAVRDAGRILRLPPAAVAAFLDTGAPIANQDHLVRIAGRLVGLPRHLGVHCGGLLITPCPLTDVTPLTRAANGVVITQYEKDQAEAIGLVKMDLLGNSALSVIHEGARWLARAGKPFPEPGPHYDFKVNRLFAHGDTLGVYQCESPGMRQLCRALKPVTPKEVAAALSLIRPGPAAAGMKDAFIRRRRRLDPVAYLHPKMAAFLHATYGVMLYQEDVMKVAVNLAGYSLADADVLRRAVSKHRDSDLFRKEQNRFLFTRAPTAGIDARTAAAIWDQVSRFASYSYCKAHASVYARLAWLMARLKVHHPREFYTAILNCHNSMYPKRVFVWDALRHGIPVLPPDIHASELGWTSTARGVRAGLDLVKGLHQSLLRQILDERQRQPFRDLHDLCRRVRFRAVELERLILVGACRAWGTREALLAACDATGRNQRQPDLFHPHGKTTGEEPRPTAKSWMAKSCEITAPDAGTEPNEQNAGAAPPLRGQQSLGCMDLPELPDLMASELALTDIPFARHPVDAFAPGICRAADLPCFIDRQVTMHGILDAWKITHTQGKTGTEREMSFATLEDATGIFELVLFPDTHAQFAPRIRTLGPYRVHGTVRCQWDSLTLELDALEES